MQSRMEKVDDVLKQMTAEELDEVIERALCRRDKRFYRFLDLPPELRNLIYCLVVRSDEVKSHISKHIAPSLLSVNRQIRTEFRGLYYSNKFMWI